MPCSQRSEPGWINGTVCSLGSVERARAWMGISITFVLKPWNTICISGGWCFVPWCLERLWGIDMEEQHIMWQVHNLMLMCCDVIDTKTFRSNELSNWLLAFNEGNSWDSFTPLNQHGDYRGGLGHSVYPRIVFSLFLSSHKLNVTRPYAVRPWLWWFV